MHISLAAEKIIEIGPFIITNSMLITYLVMIILIIFSLLARRKMTSVPGKLQNIFEFVIESLLGLIEGITQDREKAKKFLPLVATLFVFILLSNWLELIPGFESIGFWKVEEGEKILVPLFRSPSADLNTTIALALVAIVSVQFFGLRAQGMKYFKKYINIKGPIDFFVGILETISEISRIISFAFRLFGNIFAGGILLLVITFLVPYIATIPFYGLEIFVGFIQALVFAILTTVFLETATIVHEEAHN